MANRPRSTPKPEDDPRELLAALLGAPTIVSETRRPPIGLRSMTELRRQALQGFRVRTWVDTWLQHGERLLLVLALLVFGYWVVDGPLRDWLHEQEPLVASAPVAVAAIASLPAAGPAKPRADTIIPLPSVHIDTASAPPMDGFMAPRQATVSEPLVIAPQPNHLVIPALQLDTPVKEVFVVEGEWQVADYAAGYLHDTGLPGSGNTVLAGHAGLRGAVFRDLGALVPNDDIYLDAAGWRYHYRVRDAKSVWPNQVEVLDPTPTPVLTLMTCTNWDTQRLVVVAELIDSKPLPSP
ncbi:MAG: sortase [Roseiflexaceae bacterium]